MQLIFLRLKNYSSLHLIPILVACVFCPESCECKICEQSLSLLRKLLSHPTTSSGSHYSLTITTISLTFVHLQGRASMRVPERMGTDGSETTLESESFDPEHLRSEDLNPRPAAKLLHSDSCYYG